MSAGAMAGVGLLSSVAGAITGAVGSVYQGSANAAMYTYQAGVAQINSVLAKQDANWAIESGNVEAQQAGMKAREQIGLTRVAQGAGNIDVNTGSARAVTNSEGEIARQNQAIIESDALKKAYGFSVQSAKDVAQAGAYQTAAQTSQTTGDIGAISSLIGGVGSVSSKFSSGSTSGAFANLGGGLVPGSSMWTPS